MSDAAGDSSSWAIRWRAVYDVAIGVVLFLVLLVPAMRQASTGTHAGLRHAMLLLLLDLVVLVMLSRYMTSEGRQRLWGPAVDESPADPPLPPEEVAGLLDSRGAPSPELGLVFTDDDIAIRQGAEDHAPLAHLAWSDCAAVVASEVDAPDGTAMVFLQFVAVREDRIRPCAVCSEPAVPAGCWASARRPARWCGACPRGSCTCCRRCWPTWSSTTRTCASCSPRARWQLTADAPSEQHRRGQRRDDQDAHAPDDGPERLVVQRRTHPQPAQGLDHGRHRLVLGEARSHDGIVSTGTNAVLM